MIRRHITALRLAMMAADLLSALFLFVIVSLFRFGPGWVGLWDRAGLAPLPAAVVYATIWMATLWFINLYRLRARLTGRRELVDIVRAALLVALAVFSALFVFRLENVSRLFLVEFFAAQVLVTIGSRTIIRAALRWARSRGYSTRFILIVGSGVQARAFAARVERRRDLGLRVIGYLAEEPGPGLVGQSRILGGLEDIEEIFHSRVVDEVAICLPATWLGLVEPIARLCQEEGKIVRIPADEVAGLTLPGGRLEDFDGMAVLSLVYGPDRIIGLVLKRSMDIVGAGLGLAVLSPVFLALGVLLLMAEGRPILFGQERVGLHGRTFRMLKFRTMLPGAEARLAELEALNEVQGQAFKLSHDPRISRLGRALRHASLDELPQLWNVLTGSMSLVGPRPPLPREVEAYDLWHRRRLSMKPGITGLWQVSARGEPEFDRWVSLDLDYIDRWSLWLDLKIMARTIPAMLGGR